MKKIIDFKIVLFVIGGSLLAVNVFGLFSPLKNPDIYHEPKTGFENDTKLSPKETFLLLEKLDRNDKAAFVSEANAIFNKSIAHYWEDDGIEKYNMAVPFHENWILASLRSILPSVYERYEYCGYKKTIERGVGICSQHAIALVDFLNRNDIKARVIGLDGHVVATAEIENDKWWVIDPDFGVVIPHDIKTIETDHEIIKNHYEGKLYRNSDITIERIIGIYGPEGNIVYPEAKIGHVGYIDCNWKKVVIERSSYILKWLLPISLLLLLIYTAVQERHERE